MTEMETDLKNCRGMMNYNQNPTGVKQKLPNHSPTIRAHKPTALLAFEINHYKCQQQSGKAEEQINETTCLSLVI